MQLELDSTLTIAYSSSSQMARRVTEAWMVGNMYCLRCGALHLGAMKNNSPVADLYCASCKQEFELKSKKGRFSSKVSAGAYHSMIERIQALNNPDFFFMNYRIEEEKWTVSDLLFVPKHFFTPAIIEKRKPLAETARRAGWVGCNILLSEIPKQGKIDIIEHGAVISKAQVNDKMQQACALDTANLRSRGWLLDTLQCVNKLCLNGDRQFKLADIYQFEEELSGKHPENKHVRDKIRQQLQLLRDRGHINFLGRGLYEQI